MKIYIIKIFLLVFFISPIELLSKCLPQNQELVNNGNFEQNLIDFKSDYTYNPSTGWNEGTFNITKMPSAWKPEFANCGDHSSGKGNMLCVNGASKANQVIWSKSVNIKANTWYSFSSWFTSLDPKNPPVLQFSINGNLLGTPFFVSSKTCFWQKFFSEWFSQTNTQATISLVNQNVAGSGNDFAIDDISFRECSCELLSAGISDTTIKSGDTNVCLPINIYITTTDTSSSKLIYYATLKFSANAFLPDTISGVKINGNHIINGLRIIDFSDTLLIHPGLNKLADLCGTALIPDSVPQIFEITDFISNDQLFCISKPAATINITGVCALALRQVQIFNPPDIVISPNPVNNILNVSLKGDFVEHSEVLIYNLLGNKIYSEPNLNLKNEMKIEINASKYNSGTYVFVIRSGANLIRKLFLIE